jgi:hypothetical protein
MSRRALHKWSKSRIVERTRAVAGSRDRTLRVWDLQSAKGGYYLHRRGSYQLCLRSGRLFDILRNHFAANQIFMDEKEERLDAERREERAPRVLEKATKEQPWQNSLGMKFVPVVGTQVLFNIWNTRLEDFHAFVESAGYDTTEGMYSIGKDGWKRPVQPGRSLLWLGSLCQQAPFNPIAQNFLLKHLVKTR